MKIYILPVPESLQPSYAKFLFPCHHTEDYGMEQDFLKFLYENTHLITENPQEADFHYLPVFWSRWMLNHEWGTKDYDLLKLYVERALLDDSKTFTVCHLSIGTQLNLGKTVIFWASRNSGTAIDIPLICNPFKLPTQLPDKKYLASFVGYVPVHPVRGEMIECFNGVTDTYLCNENKGVDFYVEKILESYITLCPRGAGGSSFRFFETMQLGGVPFLIGMPDTRPFKKYINWDEYSFYAEEPQKAVEMIKSCKKDKLVAMGRACAELWKESLTYGKWCEYVLRELSDLESNLIN
jgi:Exostosin family